MLNKKLKLQRCHGLPFPRALLRHRREGILNGDLKSKSECIQSLSSSFKGKHACPLWVNRRRTAAARPRSVHPLTAVLPLRNSTCAMRHAPQINSSRARPEFPQRTAAFRVKRRAHADQCMNRPGGLQTRHVPVPRWPSVLRGERHSRRGSRGAYRLVLPWSRHVASPVQGG